MHRKTDEKINKEPIAGMVAAGMEWFLVVTLIGTIYFAFDTNFILGIVVLIINLIFIHQKDWSTAQTTIGKFFNKHIQRRWW